MAAYQQYWWPKAKLCLIVNLHQSSLCLKWSHCLITAQFFINSSEAVSNIFSSSSASKPPRCFHFPLWPGSSDLWIPAIPGFFLCSASFFGFIPWEQVQCKFIIPFFIKIKPLSKLMNTVKRNFNFQCRDKPWNDLKNVGFAKLTISRLSEVKLINQMSFQQKGATTCAYMILLWIIIIIAVTQL